MKVGKEIRSFRNVTSKISNTAAVKGVGTTFFLKVALAALAALSLALSPLHLAWSVAQASPALNVWWPTEGVRLSGTQPFKAALEGAAVEGYEMFWQVDGGALNRMETNYADYPHKETSADVSSWNWKGSGPYQLNFIARQNGVTVAERGVTIYVGPSAVPSAPAPSSSAFSSLDPVQFAQMWELVKAVDSGKDTDPVHVAQAQAFKSAQEGASSPSATPATSPAPSAVLPHAASATTPITGNFYVNHQSPAAAQAQQWRHSRPNDAQKMDSLASAPTAQWFGGWSGDIQSAVERTVSAARAQSQTPVLVAYNIPQRDCGGFSAGGTNDYQSWIGAFARGIANNAAIVVLEPDALAGITCLSSDDQRRRLDLLAGAVSILKSNPNTKVYLDAGHSGWIEPSIMAGRLEAANVARADGFATNVSNFKPTSDEISYGTRLSERLGGKRFVIDTSRNGNGSNGEWCNPWGRAVGQRPTTSTGNPLVDAYVWVKTPGESDGNCNGGPSAGTWWPDYALHLVR